MAKKKEFDVVVWGATGFTGSLVAEYYVSRYGCDGEELRWAMAGRSESKLKEVAARIGADVPLVVADSNNRESLEAMVSRTKVVLTTVGPYAFYGNTLVEVCAEQGVGYVDLSGEVPWIRRMIDEHEPLAKENGAKIVNCCGFDSIPSDLGTLFLQNAIKEKSGETAKHVKMRLKNIKGGLSGGTFLSLDNVMAEARSDKAIYKTLFNPYGLNPRDAMKGNDVNDITNVQYDKDFGVFITPFVMAAINTRIVRRSHALQDFPYGEDFRYDEAMMSGNGVQGRLKGYANIAYLGAITLGKPDGLYRTLVRKVLPSAGEGPNKEERESGFWKFKLIGVMADGSTHFAHVSGDRDPGYGSTSKMIGEAAACLALDEKKLPKVSGMLTPASAMGTALIDRLEASAGLKFSFNA